MKKFLAIMTLCVVLTGGAAVAQHHPGGLGIGLVMQGGATWNGGGFGINNLAVSLKLPAIPIYWGINLDLFHDDWFGIGVTGDKYLIDAALVPDIGLGWFFGLGGYANVGFYTGDAKTWDSDNNKWIDWQQTNIGLGVRVPIGLDLLFFDKKLEIFLDVALSFGVGIGVGTYYGTKSWQHDPLWLDGGWGGDLGLRVWL